MQLDAKNQLLMGEIYRVYTVLEIFSRTYTKQIYYQSPVGILSKLFAPFVSNEPHFSFGRAWTFDKIEFCYRFSSFRS